MTRIRIAGTGSYLPGSPLDRGTVRTFLVVNQIYAEFFPALSPARSTVQVAALPRDASVEIDAVA
jgi:enamine deaminase RidA (YjgF/YER057c/UK114 family)